MPILARIEAQPWAKTAFDAIHARVADSVVAHGSIRTELVFMALGQSAATAAGAALDQNVSVQDLLYLVLRARLIAAK